jgi:gamma-glutamyl hercynylcysteine S-oxide synthase
MTAGYLAERAVGASIRRAAKPEFAEALAASRRDTLATFAVYEAAFADTGFSVPQRAELNPPLWELGHINWFQQHWLARNPQWQLGVDADPFVARHAAERPGADALYDSSQVAHATRWDLPLPDARATRADLASGLVRSLALLPDCGDDHRTLYFHRLCLLHEDMHHEAALYMAQSLGLAVADARWQPQPLATAARPLHSDAGPWELGSQPSDGFAFDNELAPHVVHLPACAIDSTALRWADFLPFVEAGGYADARWWSAAGLAWRDAGQRVAPRYLRRDAAGWQQWRWGHWRALDPALPACHLSAFEAQAWCAWAGRRLPSEAEWERAALLHPDAFTWGQVWEWTASAFEPYPGFVAHPYRDYSAPWFGSRRVLRGASFCTQPRMKHPRYRNFFPPERNDIFAGFRSCAA